MRLKDVTELAKINSKNTIIRFLNRKHYEEASCNVSEVSKKVYTYIFFKYYKRLKRKIKTPKSIKKQV